eukprot:6134865-Prymnesium_polylepis.1
MLGAPGVDGSNGKLVPIPPPGSPPSRHMSADVRMIWTAGGFISPYEGQYEGSRLELPTLGSPRAAHGLASGKSIASSIGHKSELPREISALYSPSSLRDFGSGAGPPQRAATARGSRTALNTPLSEDKRCRLLERRNQKLEAELRQALNLYGQSVNWLEQEREKQKEAERVQEAMQQREAEALFAKER